MVALAALPLAVVALSPVVAALAQKYPSRPIRVMLPFAAGSVSDVTLRILADKLGTRLGTSIVVENQPRAGGTTAALAAKTATADGYTLVTLFKFDGDQRVAAQGPALRSGRRFHADLGHQHLRQHHRGQRRLELPHARRPARRRARAAGRAQHRHHHGRLDQPSRRQSAEVDDRAQTFVIVPFRTPGDLLTAVLRNDVDAIIQSYGALKSAVESNQIRALGITTPKRTAYAPNVPTVDEAGVTGFDVVTWNGAFAPAGTPPEVIGTLNREMRAALSDPELVQRYTELGLEPLADHAGRAFRAIAGRNRQMGPRHPRCRHRATMIVPCRKGLPLRPETG